MPKGKGSKRYSARAMEKARIQRAVDKMFSYSIETSEEGGQNNYFFREKQKELLIQRYGAKVVKPILSKLMELDKANLLHFYRVTVWDASRIISECATPNHAVAVARVLNLEGIIADCDRSARGRLLEALVRIGHTQALDHLAAFMESAKRIPYGVRHSLDLPREVSFFRKLDCDDIAWAIEACKKRQFTTA